VEERRNHIESSRSGVVTTRGKDSPETKLLDGVKGGNPLGECDRKLK